MNRELDNCTMAEVCFFPRPEKLVSALDHLGIADFTGATVPVKLHMGEPGNKYYIPPSVVKLVVTRLKNTGAKPFLFDTTVAYAGPRSTKDGYKRVAFRHGFAAGNMGCEVIIGERGVTVIEGGHSFEVAEEIFESTHLVVMSHVKGHTQAGFGGAIKNLGTGGVTKGSKRMIHRMSMPSIDEAKCDLCGACVQVCPSRAITVNLKWVYDSTACEGCGKCVSACQSGALSEEVMDLQKGLALAARACIQAKRVLYVNALVNITRNCDCDPHPEPVICPDIGYLASNELTAIDRASLELINEAKPGVFERIHGIDPSKQVRYAQEADLLSCYELKRL